ncbi:2-phosphoxylose phosphatase 1-like [Asterias amurensis]|uniref:2-phosphoxylose phosphatase 1-like n=1 Tax=Asterias amurensis TaxID=7602 RepID=UPI003AB49876
MAYIFRKKHALSGFAMLLFFCTLWMLHQQEEISHELSTSSDDDLLPAHVLYPVGELQYKKERQRIILNEMEGLQYQGPVETRRGNYQIVPTPVSNHVPDTPRDKKSEDKILEEQVGIEKERIDKERTKLAGLSKKVKSMMEKKKKPAKRQNETIDVPELSLLEMEEFQTRIKEYCNSPSEPYYGAEGKVRGGYQLQYVHVVARHGDRTPITQLGLPNIKMDRRFNCDLETAKNDFPSSQLLPRFVASVVAQDEAQAAWPQMPMFLRTLPIGSNARECAIAQLTPTGWLQLMRLGQHMKIAYEGKLVPHQGYFRNPNTTLFKSTMNARTQQSVFAFMFGFLPRLELHFADRIKITENTAFCSLGKNCSCQAIVQLEKAKQKQYGVALKNDTETQMVLKSVAKNLLNEPKPKKVPGLTAQQDLYSSLTCHEKSLPCTPYGCVLEKHFAKIVAFTDRVSREMRSSEDGPHQKYARLVMHPLLSQIATQMKKVNHGAQNYPKFVYYSGHDITLTPLLDILGLGDYHWPCYAANVVFELWSKSESFFLRVLYNGQDKTSAVRFCRDNLSLDGLCPLRYFLRFVNKENMGYFHAESLSEACKLKV